MSETYMITAKTVEEAIAIANREYADETHEVSYEIIDMPKKGFLGIGAKDAKIKITVSLSASASVGLDSLVADLKKMKSLTDKNGDEDKPKKQQNPPKKAENAGDKAKKPQNGQQKKPSVPQKHEGKADEKKPEPVQKPAQKADKPVKTEPKPEQKAEKPAEKPQPKTEAPASEKSEKSGEYRSSLKNQGRPNRRTNQIKRTAPEEEINPTGVTVSSPTGVSQFVSGKESRFGDSSSSGRISNDIRKKKPTAAAAVQAPANTVTEIAAPKNENATVSSAEKKARAFDQLAARYDIAETDEDYENLDRLVETEGAEYAPSAKMDTVEEIPAPAEPPKPAIKEAVTKAEIECAKQFIDTLLKNMGLTGAEAVPVPCPEGEEMVTMEEATEYPMLNIIGDDSGILIGHHGETLDAIQYLANLSSLRKNKSGNGDYVKITVDIENYRAKREETLRSLARRMAARAVKYKKNVFLEPMNAYERRIIHSELQSFENVDTHSVGSDRDRKIIITYEGPDKQPDRRRGGRKNDGKKPQNTEPRKVETGEKSEEKKPRRRPRKTPKIPIEQLTSLLPDVEETPVDTTAEASEE